MTIRIEAADPHFFTDALRCDFSFSIEAEFDPQIGRPVASSSLRPLPPQRKAYGFDPEDYREHLEAPDKALLAARRGATLAGYLAISTNWNGYALIEDIAVDAGARRQGVASALLDAAGRWAAAQGLPGLMLETQNNNVAACRLYERHGFVLGGVDAWLYRGEQPDTREVALFYYRWLDGTRPA
ncbi:GNAT family N-acetyltransferase [Eleftheria terrae]|uniref:GNAT family N-acetyltransferase n=1 Tax=Eleftheria terrae TaxID=1597781 RepID=UPI00263BB73A|nr:GNAT family N-acetyltransferase [Eleftheria terrae]WKB55484.1 GNAT family N-acetyltransferase [Eleftheria terrae]